MIVIIILAIIKLLLLVIAGLLLHELGHYLACQSLGVKARFGMDRRGLYVAHIPLPNKDRITIIGWALLFSAIPAIPALLISPEYAIAYLLIMLMGQVREIDYLRLLSNRKGNAYEKLH